MKNFKYLLLSLITIICFSSFTGCDETPPPASGFEFSCNEQIENSVSESMTYFYNNIYTSNLLTNGMTYNFGQLELMYNNFNPYIELGTITNGSFDNISFGNHSFTNSEEKSIHIGNACKIKDKVVYTEDNKIYANVFVMYIELRNSSQIKINNVNIDIENDNTTTLNYYYFSYFQNSSNTIEFDENNNYNINLCSSDPLGLFYICPLNDHATIIYTYSDGSFDYVLSMSEYYEPAEVVYVPIIFTQTNQNYNVHMQVAVGNYIAINEYFYITTISE